jgi:hypothetical protein
MKKLLLSLFGVSTLGVCSAVYALPTIQSSNVRLAVEKECRCTSCGPNVCVDCEIVGVDSSGAYIL